VAQDLAPRAVQSLDAILRIDLDKENRIPARGRIYANCFTPGCAGLADSGRGRVDAVMAWGAVMRIKPLGMVAGLLLGAVPGLVCAGPWGQGALYFQIPGVELKVITRCPTPSQAEVMVGGLAATGRGTASDDPGLHPATTPAYWIRTAGKQLLALPVQPATTVLTPEGVPSGSLVFTVGALCNEAYGGAPGSFFKIYSDAQGKQQVFAFP
jgi:hypothetical protein